MPLGHPTAQRALIALVQVLSLSVWFSVTAVASTLTQEWGISSTAAVWLTASVQLGFVLGAVGSMVLNLADRIAPQVLFAVSAGGSAACTAAVAVLADGLATAVPLRALTGVFLAGVYPVGMKLMASWSAPDNRGVAFGVLIGALTLGSALPHLISGLGPLPWRTVLLTAATLSVLAAALATFLIRTGPHVDPRRAVPNPRYAIRMFTERGPRLANLGYFGHMWELYALWTWLATFVTLGRQERGEVASVSTGVVAFLSIGAAGVAGCLAGGWAADRFGRSPAAVAALTVSGACCLASPLFFNAPFPVLIAFLLVWGAAVIADSGVFSTSLSETADSRYVGTALTAQTAIGFLLTVVTIQLVPVLAGFVGWQFSFLLLAPGPAVGAIAMYALRARTTKKEDPHVQSHSYDSPGRAVCGNVPHGR